MRRLAVTLVLVGLAAPAAAQQCKGQFSASPQPRYTSFAWAQFSQVFGVSIAPGAITMIPTPLDPNNIRLPFDQNVQVKFLAEQFLGSASMGWLYMDQLSSWVDWWGNIADNDGDGIPDFYQAALAPNRPKNGLFERPVPPVWDWLCNWWPQNCIPKPPYLIDSATQYSDGGTLPHVPNVLETILNNGQGGMIFRLTDDDADFAVGPGNINWNNPFAAVQVPAGDVSWSDDGIPDYDVNGDGLVNAADRTVDLGVLTGNRELVFFYNNYINQRVKNEAVGVPDGFGVTATLDTPVMTFFTKPMLNSDKGAVPPNRTLARINIGCAWNGWGWCPGPAEGWLDPPMLARLNTPAYGNVVLPSEVKVVANDGLGYSPHLLVASPSNYPDLWLIGEEGQVNYENATCGCGAFWPPPGDPKCNCGNRDFNDVVTIVQTDKGGSVVSQNLSVQGPIGVGGPIDIPAPFVDDYTITKLYLELSATFPPPCLAPPASRVDYYWSIDDGASWHQVALPPGPPPWKVTIDVLNQGYSGSRLRWKANLITNVLGCRPEVRAPTHVGYEAVPGGEYQLGEAIPLANVLYRGTYETSRKSWSVTGGDRSSRGHLRVVPLYTPETLVAANKKCPPACDNGATCLSNGSCGFWDAGERLAARHPDTRRIYYGAGTSFDIAAGAGLNAQILAPAVRNSRQNNALVYDLDGNGVVNDDDARRVIQWTRGWEVPNQQRAWKLGAIVHSTVVAVGPAPGNPWWLQGAGTPLAERTAYNTYVGATANNPTSLIVAAHDGLIHAFEGGAYRDGDDLTTPAIEGRGYFKRINPALPARDYGKGEEAWAYAPSSLLDNYKNNLPQVKAFQPDLNQRALLDGQAVADDIFYAAAFRTIVVVPHGDLHPYITALNVSGPIPASQWAKDWTDLDFQGTYFGPALSPTQTVLGRRHTVATGSGRRTYLGHSYLFLIDAGDGTTTQKIWLSQATGPAMGTVGHPVLVDADGNGVADRAYAADTNGVLYKVNTANGAVCVLGKTGGQPLNSQIVVDVKVNDVRLYAATGDDPDIDDGALNPAWVYAFRDTDVGGACNSAQVQWKAQLPAGHRVWAAPAVSGDELFVATSTGNRLDVCANDPAKPGAVFAYSLAGGVLAWSSSIVGGDAVGGVRAYDGHLFVNSGNAVTTMIGGPQWNNTGGNVQSVFRLPTTSWSEQ